MPECRNCLVANLDPYRNISGRPDDRYADFAAVRCPNEKVRIGVGP